MAKKIKKGSYWRLAIRSPDDPWYVALEDGWSYVTLNFAVVTKDNTGVFRRFCIDTDRLYRCKKDGSWFSPSAIQHENTRWLSLQWQIKGATASLCKGLERAGQFQQAEFIKAYIDEQLKVVDIRRKQSLELMRKRKEAENYHILGDQA